MAADAYENVKDVESTAATSTLSGARTAGQILQAADGKDSTALDSTAETSTLAGARSAEQIMQQMDEEKKAKSASAKSSAKSTVKSELNKWKSAGVNAKSTTEKALDAGETVKDTVENVADKVTSVQNTASKLSAVTSFGASALGIKAGEAISNAKENAQVSVQTQVAAPTDTAIAAYQRDVADAKSQGAHVKQLPYTNAQQMQWNAQDQHRMYSNYGNMYEHGANEMEYNTALLNSAMAAANLPTKALSMVPSFKQKFLAAVQKDDNQMDINGMTLDRIFSGDVDLLKVDQKESTEDLSMVNAGRDAGISDKFEAVDHQLDARDAEKNAIASAFSQAATENTKGLADSVLAGHKDRGATVDIDLGLTGGAYEKQAEDDLSADFF